MGKTDGHERDRAADGNIRLTSSSGLSIDVQSDFSKDVIPVFHCPFCLLIAQNGLFLCFFFHSYYLTGFSIYKEIISIYHLIFMVKYGRL